MVPMGARLFWRYHAHQSQRVKLLLPDAPPLDGQGGQHGEGQHPRRRACQHRIRRAASGTARAGKGSAREVASKGRRPGCVGRTGGC
jgi:hypothetical protein